MQKCVHPWGVLLGICPHGLLHFMYFFPVRVAGSALLTFGFDFGFGFRFGLGFRFGRERNLPPRTHAKNQEFAGAKRRNCSFGFRLQLRLPLRLRL